MVPGTGTISNLKKERLAEEKQAAKTLLLKWKDAGNPEREKLFSTLADWNSYLEKTIPDLKGPKL